jgi:hypothetical protein
MTKPIQAYLPDGARCSSCYDAALNRRATCTGCGDLRRVYFPQSICATCLDSDPGPICVVCGIEARLYRDGRCDDCEVIALVDQALLDTGDSGSAIAALVQQRGNGRSTLGWIRKSKSWPIIVEFLHLPELTTASFERLAAERSSDPKGHDTAYARSLLTAADILPASDHVAVRFDTWASEQLACLTNPSARWLLRRFHRERLLSTVERAATTGRDPVGTVRWARARLRAALQLHEWLEPHGGIMAINRTLLDKWFIGPTSRHNVRDFIRWLIRTKTIALPHSAMPTRSPLAPPDYLDHDERANIARHLLHDPGVDLQDRVAGLLAVLYAQHLSRIVVLRDEDVQPDGSAVRLGTAWLDVPAPMDSHFVNSAAASRQVAGCFVASVQATTSHRTHSPVASPSTASWRATHETPPCSTSHRLSNRTPSTNCSASTRTPQPDGHK